MSNLKNGSSKMSEIFYKDNGGIFSNIENIV